MVMSSLTSSSWMAIISSTSLICVCCKACGVTSSSRIHIHSYLFCSLPTPSRSSQETNALMRISGSVDFNYQVKDWPLSAYHSNVRVYLSSRSRLIFSRKYKLYHPLRAMLVPIPTSWELAKQSLWWQSSFLKISSTLIHLRISLNYPQL